MLPGQPATFRCMSCPPLSLVLIILDKDNSSGNNLSLAEASLLGRGVAKLVEVNLSRTFLTWDQLNAIALEVTRARYTRCLDLSYNDLSTLLPNLLADLVASLSTVSLEESHLVEAQVEKVSRHSSKVLLRKSADIQIKLC